LKYLLLCAFLVGLTCGEVGAGRAGAAPEPIDIKRAIDIALEALKDRPIQWTNGCNIRVRRGKDDWALYFEPVPMGPGFDVMVIVHADGSTTIAPGY
jgi:hypothetical protein